MEELGLEYLIDKKYHSKIITPIIEPKTKDRDFNEMHYYFSERGFTIYLEKLMIMMRLDFSILVRLIIQISQHF